jgi:hypothetical protein
MTPDDRNARARRIIAEAAGMNEFIPADIAGPAPLTLDELAAAMRIEARLLNEICDLIERARAVARVLDECLASGIGGPWRYDTRLEDAGAVALDLLRAFRAH